MLITHKIYLFTLSCLGLLSSCDSSAVNKVAPSQESKEVSPKEKTNTLPAFSWDTLPLYMHARKATAFDKKEIQYLSQFPLVTLEKTTGMKTYGSSEAGTIEAAKAIKKFNSKTKVLYYRNVLVHYPFYASTKELKILKNPFLLNQKGQGKLVRKTNEAYDLSNVALRQWWVKTAAEVVANPAIDGLFLDGNIKVLETNYLKSDLGIDKKQAVVAGYREMMQETRDHMSVDKLMIANIIRARFEDSGMSYLKYFDGSYLENFEKPIKGISREDYLVKGIAATQQAAKAGKLIAMTLGLGEYAGSQLAIDDTRKDLKDLEGIQERLDYCIALFLICAEKYSYLNIHDGYDMNRKANGTCHSKVWLKSFPEYRKPLGKPLGPATKKGYVYTREFKHLSVSVDLQSQKAKLVWH